MLKWILSSKTWHILLLLICCFFLYEKMQSLFKIGFDAATKMSKFLLCREIWIFYFFYSLQGFILIEVYRLILWPFVLSYFRRALSITRYHLIVNYYIFIYIVGCLLLIVYQRWLFYVFLLPVNVLLMFQYLSNISIILLIWINNIGNENSYFL